MICIDGGSATGKTTVGNLLATRLKVDFLDTGLLYRYVTLQWLKGRSLTAATVPFVVDSESETETVANLASEDVDKLFGHEVESSVAELAGLEVVRSPVTAWTRKWAERRVDSVVVGRDGGSYVFPEAKLKVFLLADLEVQAIRRNPKATGAELRDAMVEIDLRDSADRNRELSPLRPANDAIEIDVSDLSAAEVVELIAQQLDRVDRPSQPS